MPDTADLVAKLDALPEPLPDWRTRAEADFFTELWDAWPRLRAIVVAAQAYVDAEVEFAKHPSVEAAARMFETRAGLVAAVRGEA